MSVSNFVMPQHYVTAGSSAKWTGQLTDLNSSAIGSGDVSAMTLSLIDDASGNVVNSVSLTNILNAGRGSLDLLGICSITLTPADTAMIVTTDHFEIRSLVIDFTFTGKVGRHIVKIGIVAAPGTQPN